MFWRSSMWLQYFRQCAMGHPKISQFPPDPTFSVRGPLEKTALCMMSVRQWSIGICMPQQCSSTHLQNTLADQLASVALYGSVLAFSAASVYGFGVKELFSITGSKPSQVLHGLQFQIFTFQFSMSLSLWLISRGGGTVTVVLQYTSFRYRSPYSAFRMTLSETGTDSR